MDVSRYLEPRPAPAAIFESLAERRDRPRYVAPDGRAITWGEHAREIRAVARWLGAAGFAPGDRAAIFAANRVEWMTAAMAIQAAGGVLVPIYASSTVEQAAYVIRHSDAKIVFVEPGAKRDANLDAREIAPLGGDEWRALVRTGTALDDADPSVFDRALAAISLDRPGLMLYTSGTSGPPKGVPLTHRNVAVNGADWLRVNAPLLDEGMIDLHWLPFSHIFGLGEACLGNTLGWTTYLADPATVAARLHEVGPSVFMSVPRLWEKLAAAAQGAPDPRARLAELTGGRLRFCLSGGAGLKREVKEFFRDCGVLLLEGYGLTECSPTLTLNHPDDYRFDSVGKPLPSIELKLAEDGEILARGPSVFSGYHKDPGATAEAFTPDGWFKTGDVGRFTDDGFLQIVDRKKDILVTAGGKNVAPANIEIRFLDDPLIAHVVVYGDAKPYLVAGIWVADPPEDAARARALVEERVAAVNAELASFERIKRFAVLSPPLTVESGLLTPTLKVRRKKVYERFRDRFEGLYR